jgi:hypothetical protein
MIGEGSSTFSGLPSSVVNGGHYYCSNCKNSVDDAVAVGAQCVTGGHGALALGLNSQWRCY